MKRLIILTTGLLLLGVVTMADDTDKSFTDAVKNPIFVEKTDQAPITKADLDFLNRISVGNNSQR